MVSFIANPDIALAREERKLALAKMLQGYTPPQNPYGYTTAGVFAPLVHALSARWKGQEASKLQAQQQAAQAVVESGVSGAALPKSGPFYETTQTPVSGIAPGPGAVQTQIQRIADDGSVLPPEISAETARTAGIDPLTLKTLMDDAKRTGKVATQEAIEREALKGFQQAVSDLTRANERGTLEEQAAARNIVDQWQAIVDPSAVLVDIQERQRLEAERKFEQDEKWSGVNFRVTEPFTYKGVDYKAGDEFFVNVRDPAFEPHRNKGVSIKKTVTEAGENVSPLDQMRSGSDTVPGDASETAPSVTPDSVKRTEEESRILAQADQILERGSVTFVNQLERAGNWFSAYFVGGRDPFPAEREGTAQINALRNILLAPLVKAISVRGGRFAIENINPILPNSGEKPPENLARIRQLIPRYERELELLNDAYYASKDGSVQQVNIGKTQGIIIDMLPLLKAIVRESSLGPGGDGDISLSPGSSFSAEKATEAPVGTQIEDVDENTGEARKWEKISNKGPTGEWRRID